MNWTYKGITIVVNDSTGKFEAAVKEQEISEKTLDGCKEKIDKVLKQKLPRIKLYKTPGCYGGINLVPCEITSISRTPTNYGSGERIEFWATEIKDNSRGKYNAQVFYKNAPKIVNKVNKIEAQIKKLNIESQKLSDSIQLNEKELLKLLGFKGEEI